MVREGCHLPPYLKNTWAILEAFSRGEKNTSLTQVRPTFLMGSDGFHTLLYFPVLLSVLTLHTASKSTKVAEDKQPNY